MGDGGTGDTSTRWAARAAWELASGWQDIQSPDAKCYCDRAHEGEQQHLVVVEVLAAAAFGLCVLDYTATANCVHLLVRDRGQGEIAASMQLVQGRTAQAYNRRKRRRGAFWADQYHATAVETGAHRARCVVYIDLNMVRAGVVDHPAAWEVGGYHEIQQARARYRIVDRAALAQALGVVLPALADMHRHWVEAALRDGHLRRDRQWTDSVAAGSRRFVEALQHNLGRRGRYRAIEPDGDSYVLRYGAAVY